ncbi:MAG: multidrug effflux MFS transporter [Silicimonas sp.]|nr:multidrug effflux MFS transporter [Silicimonas sp.]
MTTTAPSNDTEQLPVRLPELVGILAMMSATVAFSIDAMLPAFPQIGTELSPDAPNRVQLIVATFMVGLGLGTLVAGPLSDAFGRQRVAIYGTILIVICALTAAFSPSLELLLVARFIQGLGSAGPRVASMAIVRDLFRGRDMARIMSFVIFVFTLAPVFAPTIGWALTAGFGWRAIFVSFAIFTLISTGWLLLRLPETLNPANVRPFRPALLISGARELVSVRNTLLATGAQMLVFAILMSALMSSQQVFHVVFDQGAHFHLWFGLTAVLSAGANLVNAKLVMRLGMKKLVIWALICEGLFTALVLGLSASDTLPPPWIFPLGFIWFTSVFYMASFTIGNLTSIAMEPVGHMAGLAASIISAVATVAGIAIAAPIGQAFNGTLVPLTLGVTLLCFAALALVRGIDDSES